MTTSAPACGKRAGDAEADAAGRSGDDCHAAGKRLRKSDCSWTCMSMPALLCQCALRMRVRGNLRKCVSCMDFMRPCDFRAARGSGILMMRREGRLLSR